MEGKEVRISKKRKETWLFLTNRRQLWRKEGENTEFLQSQKATLEKVGRKLWVYEKNTDTSEPQYFFYKCFYIYSFVSTKPSWICMNLLAKKSRNPKIS